MRGIVSLLLLCNLLFPVEAFVSRRTTVGVERQLYHQQKKCSPILSKKKNFNFKLFSQWMDDEEETTKKEADKMKAAVRRSPSYDEAGSTMEQEDDDAEMAQSGGNDFDTTDYKSANVEKYAEAIKKRADALGIEGLSLEEKQRIEQAAMERAINARETGNAAGPELEGGDGGASMASGTPGGGGDGTQLSQMLDLSQITNEKPTGPNEDLPAFMYNPADDMTEEEIIEADPKGQLPIYEQAWDVVKNLKTPPFVEAITDLLILVVTIIFTCGTIYNWDNLMREGAFFYELVPRPEDTMKAMSDGDIVLPPERGPLNGADLLNQLKESGSALKDAVQDGTLLDQLQQAQQLEQKQGGAAGVYGGGGVLGDVPSEL